LSGPEGRGRPIPTPPTSAEDCAASDAWRKLREILKSVENVHSATAKTFFSMPLCFNFAPVLKNAAADPQRQEPVHQAGAR
jgi:hypothetical protein